MIENLTIDNFKIFKHLEIEKLGRVNLITGKNNVGKSCLLEAVHLFEEKGARSSISKILRDRDQVLPSVEQNYDLHESSPNFGLLSLFHRGKDEDAYSFQINTKAQIPASLSLSVLELSDLSNEQKDHLNKRYSEGTRYDEGTLLVQIRFNDVLMYIGELDSGSVRTTFAHLPSQKSLQRTVSVLASGLEPVDINEYWGNAVLNNKSDLVKQTLKIIDGDINDFNIIPDSQRRSRSAPVISLEKVIFPVPLKSHGEGLSRLLGIILSLVNARGGALLIDEIDIGLHFSIMIKMWDMVIKVAKEFDIQVFATTHNWDCIEAFQEAARENSDESAYLIRLNKDEEGIYPTIFDKDELHVATREDIEVR